jgi:hypothetical protein
MEGGIKFLLYKNNSNYFITVNSNYSFDINEQKTFADICYIEMAIVLLL